MKRLYTLCLLSILPAFGAVAVNDVTGLSQVTKATTPIASAPVRFAAEGAIGATLASFQSAIGFGIEDSPVFTGLTLSTGGALGVSTATSINGIHLTASTGTLTVGTKTLVVSNTLTLAGTDGTTMTFPATTATLARTDAAQTFTGTQTFASQQQVTDGNAGAPAFSFTTDPDCGLYKDNTNQIGLSTGGTAGFIMNSSRAIRFNAYGVGTITSDSSGNLTAVSDARMKDIGADFTTGLTAIRKLTPKFYHWNRASGLNTEDVNVSLIAQDVQAAGLPEAVATYRTVDVMENAPPTLDEIASGRLTGKLRPKRDAGGATVTQKIESTYTVSDRVIIAALVNAIKELGATNDALLARVAKLEAAK